MDPYLPSLTPLMITESIDTQIDDLPSSVSPRCVDRTRVAVATTLPPTVVHRPTLAQRRKYEQSPKYCVYCYNNERSQREIASTPGHCERAAMCTKLMHKYNMVCCRLDCLNYCCINSSVSFKIPPPLAGPYAERGDWLTHRSKNILGEVMCVLYIFCYLLKLPAPSSCLQLPGSARTRM